MSYLQDILSGLSATDEKLFNKINKSGYATAFQIYANDIEYPSGTTLLTDLPWIDSTDEDLNDIPLYYTIPVGMTQKFALRTYTDTNKQDVVIDWGDGKSTNINDLTDSDHKKQADDEFIYLCEHTYTTPGKYIVKILGTQYLAIYYSWEGSYDLLPYNLMSRCFASDLPIANHIRNLSSFAYKALRLIKIEVPSYMGCSRINNWANTFGYCYNLYSATGFSKHILADSYAVEYVFAYCESMKKCDFTLPACPKDNAIKGCFKFCYALQGNLAKIFPKTGFNTNNMKFSTVFYKCNNLSGTVPSSTLWADPNMQWDNSHYDVFQYCPSEILSQVPNSWGGTNSQIQTKIENNYWKHIDGNELSTTLIPYNEDYTAWYVYPTSADISANTYIQDLNETTSIAIPSAMTERFALKTYTIPRDQDVIIDWGDGNTTNAKDLTDYHYVNNDLQILCEHTYTEQKKYLIKIYGKKYYGFYYSSYRKTDSTYISGSNLLCQIIRIASHLTSLQSFCYNSKRLFKVSLDPNILTNITNFSEMFGGCQNLTTVIGFSQLSPNVESLKSMFRSCSNLTSIDFKIPPNIRSGELTYLFEESKKFSQDISTLFNKQNFVNKTMDMTNAFRYLTSLTGTVPANILWEDTTITWNNTSQTFLYCSSAIRTQVPTSWGGTNTEIETKLVNGDFNIVKQSDLGNINKMLDEILK